MILVAIHRGSKGNTNRLLIGKVGKVGQGMAEARGINPQITPEVTEEVKEITAEVVEEVKEATAEVVEKLSAYQEPQLVSLRETVSSEGFDDKRGWRRIMALWGSTNSPFYR